MKENKMDSIPPSPSRLDRLLVRWGASYPLRISLLAQSASFLAASLGIYYILLNVVLSQSQLLHLIGSVFVLVAIANLIVPIYGYRITPQARAGLAAWAKSLAMEQEETTSRLLADETEQQAWSEITSYPWRFARFSFLVAFFQVILPTALYMHLIVGISLSQAVHVVIGGLISAAGLIVYFFFVLEGALSPARRVLLPRSPTQQHAGLAGIRVQLRLVVIYGTLIAIALLMVGTLSYQKAINAMIPGVDLIANLRSLQVQLVLISIVALLFSFGFSYVLARSVANPIRRLIQAMAEVEAGHLSQRARVISTDEIGHLTIAFNRMAERVQASHLHLEDQVRERTQALLALNAVLTATSTSLDLDEVYCAFTDEVRKIVDFDRSSITVFEPDSQAFTSIVVATREKTEVGPGFRGERNPIMEWIITHKRPRIDADLTTVTDGGEAVKMLLKEGMRAWMLVPIIFRGEVVGTINFASRQVGAYTEVDGERLLPIAGQLGVALENSRLYKEARLRVRELDKLFDVGRGILSTLDLDTVLPMIVQAAIEAIPTAEKGTLHLLDAEKQELVVRASSGFGQEVVKAATFKVGEGYTGWVFQRGEPTIVDNVKTDPRTKPIDLPEVEEEKSAICVPLAIGGETIGTLTLDNVTSYGAFDENDLRLLSAFANQAAIAIENARLFENEQRRIEQLSAINEVGKRIASILDLEKLLPEVTTLIHETFGYYYVAVFLVDSKSNDLVFKAEAGGPEVGTPAGYRQKMKEGMIGWAAYLGEPLLANDVSKEPRYIAPYLTKTKSELDVPIKFGDKVLGVLDLQSKELNAFDESDIIVLGALADQLAVAIENARLYEETRRQSERLAQTLAVSELLHRGLELEQVLEQIAQGAVRLGFRRAVINVCQPEEELVRVRAVAGLEGPEREELKGATYRWSDFQTLMQERFRVSRSYLIRQGEVDWEKDFQGPVVVPSREDRGPSYWRPEDMLLVPLWGTSGQPVGLLSVDEPVDGLLPGLNTVRMLEAFANQAAIAIENARLYEEANLRLQELRILYEVATAASSTMDLGEVLKRMIAALHRMTRWEYLTVMLIDEEKQELRIRAEHGYSRTVRGRIRLKLGQGITGWVALHSEPALVNDVSKDSRYVVGDEKVQSELCVPLKAGDKVIGVLNVESSELSAFSESDLRLLATLGGQLAIIIENAKLYEETRRLAVTDGLTGLHNRRYFYQELEKEIVRRERYERPFSVVMFDLDDLKTFNDTYGHLAGDDLLRELAGLIRGIARRSDTAARYGGDEFIVLLPEGTKEEALAYAERMRETIRDHQFKIRNSDAVGRMTVSVGVASYPEAGKDAESLVNAVDQVLYEAKKGRDRVCY